MPGGICHLAKLILYQKKGGINIPSQPSIERIDLFYSLSYYPYVWGQARRFTDSSKHHEYPTVAGIIEEERKDHSSENVMRSVYICLFFHLLAYEDGC